MFIYSDINNEVLFAQTNVSNMCNKQYSYSYIPNITNKLLVT